MLLIITLILVGLILLGIELLIIPGFGVSGILGLLSIVGAIFFAFYQFGETTGLIVLGVTLLSSVIFTWLILRSKTWKNMGLKNSISSKVDINPNDKGLHIGQKGLSLSRIAPMGRARFGSVDTEVSSLGGIIPNSKEVEIISFEDNKIYVKQL